MSDNQEKSLRYYQELDEEGYVYHANDRKKGHINSNGNTIYEQHKSDKEFIKLFTDAIDIYKDKLKVNEKLLDKIVDEEMREYALELNRDGRCFTEDKNGNEVNVFGRTVEQEFESRKK